MRPAGRCRYCRAAAQHPPQGKAGALSRGWLFWDGSFMHRCTAAVVKVWGSARMFGLGPTYFLDVYKRQIKHHPRSLAAGVVLLSHQ